MDDVCESCPLYRAALAELVDLRARKGKWTQRAENALVWLMPTEVILVIAFILFWGYAKT